MRVTDEMKERAYAAVRSAEPGKWTRKAVIDFALETALANVPEPGQAAYNAEVAAKLADQANAAESRIAELEAQNAELRKAVDNPDFIRLCRANADVGMMNVEQHLRIAELEAQLARVREWLDSDDCDGTELLHWNLTLRELLDGADAR